MWILPETGEILSSPLGGMVYHFIILLAIEAALFMAWGEWRRTQRDQAQRLLLAMVGLTIVRGIYVVAGLVTMLGWIDSLVLLPPLERFVDAASICLLGWAFMPPGKRGVHAWDIVFGATLVVTVGFCIAFTILWGQTAQATASLSDYNLSWQAVVWGVWQLILIVLASIAVVRDRDEGWGLLLSAMLLMLVGQVLQVVYPMPASNIPWWERLSNVIAYPLIAIAVYQNIFVRLRVHSRHLQDISQASLDQIKSLLYLFEASQEMSASLDLDTVVNNAVQGIARALDADQCAIAFPEEGDAGQMRLVAIYNPGRQGRGEGVTFPLDYQLAVQHAMRRKRYIIVEEEDNVQLKVLFALLGSGEVGPLLVQPLVDGAESIGAVIVGNSRSRRPFTPNESKLCQSMAEQVVSAIRNARRYGQAQGRVGILSGQLAESERALNQAKTHVQETTDRLTVALTEVEESRRKEELAREVRNALEIKLVSTRAEADTLAERLSILDSDLNQINANAEAQIRWHEEEIARRQAALDEEVTTTEWLRTVLQGMTAGILITDTEGVIQEANVAAQILLEMDSKQLRGMTLQEISDEQRWQRAVTAAKGGEAVRLTTQVGVNTLMCDVTPLEADSPQGRMRGFVAILQDVTTEAEAQREQIVTVATMIRELRTPMTSVLNYVDLLLSEAMGSVGEEQRKFLWRIKAGAERMIQMTNDLTRETSGTEQWTAPKRQSVDVEQLIETAVAGSYYQLEDKELSLDLDLPDGLPPIKADPDYLRRVLTNLLSNACLASSEGGEIRMRVSQSEERPFDSDLLNANGDKFVIFSIQDTGGGLSDDALSRVFDRGRPSCTPAGLGESGAGLALVKMLVEAHGGRLWVESESGVGTTFSFILPVNDGVGQPRQGQALSDRGNGRSG